MWRTRWACHTVIGIVIGIDVTLHTESIDGACAVETDPNTTQATFPLTSFCGSPLWRVAACSQRSLVMRRASYTLARLASVGFVAGSVMWLTSLGAHPVTASSTLPGRALSLPIRTTSFVSIRASRCEAQDVPSASGPYGDLLDGVPAPIHCVTVAPTPRRTNTIAPRLAFNSSPDDKDPCSDARQRGRTASNENLAAPPNPIESAIAPRALVPAICTLLSSDARPLDAATGPIVRFVPGFPS